MIIKENFNEEHIRQIQNDNRRDLLLIERTVFAFGFPNYLEGTKRVTNHIFTKGFSMEKASRLAPKVIYMASCLLTSTPFERITDAAELSKESLTMPDLAKMKGLKKLDPVGYGYLVKSNQLLSAYRK